MSDDIEQVEVEAPEPTESEAKARRQGWRPQDEYRGPADKWVDADAFLKRSDEELPVMRERLRKQDRDLADLKITVTKFAEHHAKVEKIAYNAPGALVWYRDTTYGNVNHSANNALATVLPSAGSKGGLLIVDSHFDPLRRSGTNAAELPNRCSAPQQLMLPACSPCGATKRPKSSFAT